MSFVPFVVNGYTSNWYPDEEPVIPRVYHKYLTMDNKKLLYSDEEIGVYDVWFMSKPETYKSFGYGGTSCKILESSLPKVWFKDTEYDVDEDIDTRAQKAPKIVNTSKESVYVRAYIAVPKCLDGGAPTFDADDNIIHFNIARDSIAIDKWSWSKLNDRVEPTEEGEELAPVGESGWNSFTQTINGVEYNVYVAYFMTALKAGEATDTILTAAYIDPDLEDEDIAEIYNTLRSNEWEIKVAAEAVPAEDYEDPYEAFAGTISRTLGSYNVF